jgi:hypothetical protein
MGCARSTPFRCYYTARLTRVQPIWEQPPLGAANFFVLIGRARLLPSVSVAWANITKGSAGGHVLTTWLTLCTQDIADTFFQAHALEADK